MQIPQETFARQWKDRVQGFLDEILFRNQAIVREQLLDGFLVKEGILDCAAIETTLSQPSKTAGCAAELLDHLIVECWLRSWVDNPALRLAA